MALNPVTFAEKVVGDFHQLAGVLGLRLQSAGPTAAAPFIDLLITIRRELREAKQYPLADRVRTGLADLGVILEDSPAGTSWKVR